MSCNPNYKHLQINRGKYTDYLSKNPILKSGEASYAYADNFKFHILKIGDGINRWRDLPCLKFNDPVPYTTQPPVCTDDNFLLLHGGYFDLSSRGVTIVNSGSTENGDYYTIPPSSYQFDFVNSYNSPHIIAQYGKKINKLGYDDFDINFSFYIPDIKTGNNTSYGKVFPFFTIGDDFTGSEPSIGEISFNLLKTSDNSLNGSINATIFIFQSNTIKATGNSVEILPSSWYDVNINRVNSLFSASINNQNVISNSLAMSGIDIGNGLTNNNFLIGNTSFEPLPVSPENFDCYVLKYRPAPCKRPPLNEMPLVRNITTPQRFMRLSIIFDTFEQDDSLDISYVNSLGQEVFLITTGFVSGSNLNTAPDCDSPGSSPKLYTIVKPSGVTSLKITVYNSDLTETNISGIYLSICENDDVHSFELLSNTHGGHCDGSNYVGNTLDTGLYLEKGVNIKIEASGNFTVGCNQCPGQPFTPDGYILGGLINLDCIDEPFYIGQLMGKIGSSTFGAGSDIIIETKDSGNLEFFIVDDPLNDNNGSYYINVYDLSSLDIGSGTILIDNFKATKTCPKGKYYCVDVADGYYCVNIQ